MEILVQCELVSEPTHWIAWFEVERLARGIPEWEILHIYPTTLMVEKNDADGKTKLVPLGDHTVAVTIRRQLESLPLKSRPMRGFWAPLTEANKEAALAYRGPENHGDPKRTGYDHHSVDDPWDPHSP